MPNVKAHAGQVCMLQSLQSVSFLCFVLFWLVDLGELYGLQGACRAGYLVAFNWSS